MEKEQQVLELLSDGRFHSGESVGGLLGITRSAVWKKMKQLEGAYGIPIQAVRGKGYAVPDPIDLLHVDKITAELTDAARSLLTNIEVLKSLPSTHDYLLDQKKQGARSGTVCFAEHQSKGRGRRGRAWMSPFGSGIYFSLLWRFDGGPATLSGLSLALATAVVQALETYGVQPGLTLKWPNDIYWHQRKLGGVLIDVVGEANGASFVVVSVGLNVQLPIHSSSQVNQPIVDVAGITGKVPLRNKIAGLILSNVLVAMTYFAQKGFAGFHEIWQKYDVTFNQSVQLDMETRKLFGIARGVSKRGELLLDIDGDLQIVQSGDVSLRMTASH